MSSESAHSILSGKLLFPFVAPPNAGKGTQTQILSQLYPLATFDMGATFRAIMKEGADPVAKAELEKYMNAGRLVPVEIVAQVFKHHFEALAARSSNACGFILDGFPRSAEQALVLSELCQSWNAKIGAVIYLHVASETVERRATGRRFCSLNPQHLYNVYNPSLAPGRQKTDAHDALVTDEKGRPLWLCDHDNADLIIRPDDEPEKVKIRLDEYQSGTAPLLEHFRQQNLLIEIDGEKTPEEVTEAIERHLQPLLNLSPTH